MGLTANMTAAAPVIGPPTQYTSEANDTDVTVTGAPFNLSLSLKMAPNVSCLINASCSDEILAANLQPNSYNMSKLLAANDTLAKTLLPVMIYLGVLSLVGVIGNGIVCYVFAKKFNRGSQNVLIISLAVFDILSCVLAIPYEIVDLRFYAFYIFGTDVICKVFKFVNTFCNIGSIFTILIIAVDRYRKVCTPLKKQIRFYHVRKIIFLTVVVDTLFSAPAIFLYGFRTTESIPGTPGLRSRDCSTPDTLYPTIYNGVLFLTFIVLSITLSVLYTRVLKEVRRRNRSKQSTPLSKTSQVDTQASSVPSDASEDEENTTYSPNEGAGCNQTTDTNGNACVLFSKEQNDNTLSELVVNTKKTHLEVPLWKLSSPRGSCRVHTPSYHNFEQCVKDSGVKSDGRCTPATTLASEHEGVRNNETNLLKKRHSIEVEIISQAPFQGLASSNTRMTQLNDKNEDAVFSITVTSIRRSISDVTPELRRESNKKEEGGDKNTDQNKNPGGEEAKHPPIRFRRSKSDAGLKSMSTTGITRQLVLATTSLVTGFELPSKKERSASSRKRCRARNQTTMVAFSVASVFILSFLPHLILMIAKLLIFPGFDQRLQGVSFVVYNIFLRTYFINSVANPIIYGILNSQFRRQVRRMLMRVCC